MNLYKKTEGILYNYTNIKVEIENLKIEIEDIKSEVEGVSGVNTSKENTSKTNKFNSAVENEIINKEHIINKLKHELYKKQRLIKKIDNSLEVLSDTEKKVIEMKCFKKIQYKQIGQVLNLDHNYCYEVKKKAINKLINLVFIKENYRV